MSIDKIQLDPSEFNAEEQRQDHNDEIVCGCNKAYILSENAFYTLDSVLFARQ